jgi:cyclopropane fatty-acyl-phospholipid synthase-like methyltransferase
MSRRITIIIARENFVNLIIAAEVFEHLYSLINFIAKTARVLKPGGKLMLTGLMYPISATSAD